MNCNEAQGKIPSYTQAFFKGIKQLVAGLKTAGIRKYSICKFKGYKLQTKFVLQFFLVGEKKGMNQLVRVDTSAFNLNIRQEAFLRITMATRITFGQSITLLFLKLRQTSCTLGNVIVKDLPRRL